MQTFQHTRIAHFVFGDVRFEIVQVLDLLAAVGTSAGAAGVYLFLVLLQIGIELARVSAIGRVARKGAWLGVLLHVLRQAGSAVANSAAGVARKALLVSGRVLFQLLL